MPFWIKRIMLKSGELVTERELRPDENYHDGPIPVVGDHIEATYRGRQFRTKVVWGNWPDREHRPDVVVPLRVEEI